MKKKLLNLSLLLFAGISINSANAQTAGTLSFSFTEVAHSPCYSGNRHALGVWITNSAGAYISPRMRYAGSGGGTQDHLQSFASAAGVSANNCMAISMPADAVSGSTLSSFGTRTFTWNGKNTAGVLQPDGVYTIHIQTTWNHASSTSTKTYTFTKGGTADVQSPAANTDFSGVSINWTPASTVGIEEASSLNNEISVYPNPNNTGLFTVSFEQAKYIKVVNTIGDVVYNEKVQSNATNTNVDLTSLQNGIYFFVISDEQRTTSRKVILNK